MTQDGFRRPRKGCVFSGRRGSPVSAALDVALDSGRQKKRHVVMVVTAILLIGLPDKI